MANFSKETLVRIYSDDDGYFWEVRPDADGFGNVEIRYSDNQKPGEVSQSLTMLPPEAAMMLARAIIEVAEQLAPGTGGSR